MRHRNGPITRRVAGAQIAMPLIYCASPLFRRSLGDRKFESSFLQRRVRCELRAPHAVQARSVRRHVGPGRHHLQFISNGGYSRNAVTNLCCVTPRDKSEFRQPGGALPPVQGLDGPGGSSDPPTFVHQSTPMHIIRLPFLPQPRQTCSAVSSRPRCLTMARRGLAHNFKAGGTERRSWRCAGRSRPLRSSSQWTCMGLFLSSGCFWVLLPVLCSERERPFFVPSPAIRFAERAEGVKGPKR
jgi:hypothetical protein